MADTEGYLTKLCAFINSQEYLSGITADALRETSRREALGISSLAVIMLVANYMETNGLSSSEFQPEWVTKLDDVEGIVSVFREIDLAATKLPVSASG